MAGSEDQVYHPNTMPAEPNRGLACFISQQRVCGPDCMAFLPQPPEGPAYIGEQWAHCMVLVNTDRVGRHLVVLTDVVSKAASRFMQKQAEATRNQPAPVAR